MSKPMKKLQNLKGYFGILESLTWMLPRRTLRNNWEALPVVGPPVSPACRGMGRLSVVVPNRPRALCSQKSGSTDSLDPDVLISSITVIQQWAGEHSSNNVLISRPSQLPYLAGQQVFPKECVIHTAGKALHLKNRTGLLIECMRHIQTGSPGETQRAHSQGPTPHRQCPRHAQAGGGLPPADLTEPSRWMAEPSESFRVSLRSTRRPGGSILTPTDGRNPGWQKTDRWLWGRAASQTQGAELAKGPTCFSASLRRGKVKVTWSCTVCWWNCKRLVTEALLFLTDEEMRRPAGKKSPADLTRRRESGKFSNEF